MAYLLAAALCVTGAEATPIPVVLTTDFGVEADDQWALTHLALSPRVDLRAVVTTHAPGLTSDVAAEAAKVWLGKLPSAGKPEVKAGSAEALADRKTPRSNPGVELIVRESRRARDGRRVVVFVIGAATDVASALLLDPTLADRVDVVAMGFSRWPDGGDPWNVKNDVCAWQVLLDSRVPIVVGDEAVCKRRLGMSGARARVLFGTAGAPGKALIGVLDGWLNGHRDHVKRTTGDPDVWPIWDEVTVAHLLGLTEVRDLPRPRLRDDLTFDHSDPRGTIGWITSLDSVALWKDLAGCLRGTH